MQMQKPGNQYVFEQVGKGFRVVRRYKKTRMAGGRRALKRALRRIRKQRKEVRVRTRKGGFRL